MHRKIHEIDSTVWPEEQNLATFGGVEKMVGLLGYRMAVMASRPGAVDLYLPVFFRADSMLRVAEAQWAVDRCRPLGIAWAAHILRPWPLWKFDVKDRGEVRVMRPAKTGRELHPAPWGRAVEVLKIRLPMFFGKEMKEGDRYPNWYGVSYWKPEKLTAVCHPWPFNIAVGFFRKLWVRARFYWVRDSWLYPNREWAKDAVDYLNAFEKPYEDVLARAREKDPEVHACEERVASDVVGIITVVRRVIMRKAGIPYVGHRDAKG